MVFGEDHKTNPDDVVGSRRVGHKRYPTFYTRQDMACPTTMASGLALLLMSTFDMPGKRLVIPHLLPRLVDM